jgi:GNAT superfamily N-acetyltransferase
MSLEIRSVDANDVDALFALVNELAIYEGVEPRMRATPEDYRAALFGPHPRLFARLAYWSGRIAGCIVWYETYSTFAGRAKLFVEDIFVKPEFRSKRIGRSLIAEVAKLCVEAGCATLQWSVLAWNTPSIGFYRSIGADVSRERLGCNLSGEALQELALERICCLAEDGNCPSSHCERCQAARNNELTWGDPIC